MLHSCLNANVRIIWYRTKTRVKHPPSCYPGQDDGVLGMDMEDMVAQFYLQICPMLTKLLVDFYRQPIFLLMMLMS